MDVDLIEEIQGKYGEVIAQAILDHLDRGNIKDRDLQCMEVLQMSEIACRFRDYVRKGIAEYRNLETKERMLLAELDFVRKEQEAIKKDITQANSLYREAYRDFMYMFKCYMNKMSTSSGYKKKAAVTVTNYGKAKTSQVKLLDSYVVASNRFKENTNSLKQTKAA